MFLRIGMGMMGLAVVLAVVVTVFVGLRDEAPGASILSAESRPPERMAETKTETPEETPTETKAETPAEPGSGENPDVEVSGTGPRTEEGWPLPGEGENTSEPRRFASDPDAAMTLTIPALDVYDAPVFDSDSQAALNSGIAHVPETSMPWDGGAQRNVYLAAHRLGYEGTGSRLIFYELDRLEEGDEVVLEGKGDTYRYRVSEAFEVGPNASWVMGQVRGRDMVTLQTCTPIPTFEKRLIVRADRI